MSVQITQNEINIRSELASNKLYPGIKGKQLLESDNITEAREFIGAGRKNILINGSFDKWGRGDDFNNVTSDAPASDRWVFQTLVDISVNRTNIIDLNGFSNGIKLTRNAANDGSSYPSLVQYIENPDKLIGKQWTFSFYIRCNRPITMEAGKMNFNYDSIDSNGDVSPATKQQIIGTEWTRMTATTPVIPDNRTVSVGSNALMTIYLNPNDSSMDTGDWYEVTGFQIEEGSQDTEFEQRHIAIEQELCRRYLRTSDVNTRVNEYSHEMRVTPTVSGSGPYLYDAEF